MSDETNARIEALEERVSELEGRVDEIDGVYDPDSGLTLHETAQIVVEDPNTDDPDQDPIARPGGKVTFLRSGPEGWDPREGEIVEISVVHIDETFNVGSVIRTGLEER